MVSFDVTNLFPSIPPLECVNIVSNFLHSSNLSDLQTQCILRLLNLSVQQNFFLFNNSFYSQSEGLAMGSNLSPILAEIFMNDLEKNYIINNKFFIDHILFWGRYVDDIICLHTADDTSLTLFFNHLNQIHRNIKFTVEKEINNQLPFLDILLTRNNFHINYSIYRKPTTTDALIPIDSIHPFSHKLAGLNALLRRMVVIPMSPVNFQKELNIIRHIALNNGYNNNLVDTLLSKITRSIHPTSLIPQKTSKDKLIYRSLPFYPNLSYQLKNIFKAHNICISFSTTHTLNSTLVHNKDPINLLQKSGIYQLSCQTCDGFYIGRTGRSFSTRFKEHLKAIKTNNLSHKSTFAEHILASGHNFDPLIDYRILHLCNKPFLLNVLESLEIAKHKNNSSLLNEITDLGSDLISYKFITN
ncbi:hypothetical protein RI129_000891 [Pyrocoelia pectoralis]